MDINIGDKVIYHFKEGAKTDKYTLGLTRIHLNEGEIYTIKWIKHPRNNEIHYMLLEDDARSYWYPSSCFEPIYGNQIIKQKYNLK